MFYKTKNQNEREEKQMLKFKIKALMYALREMRYEKRMFKNAVDNGQLSLF